MNKSVGETCSQSVDFTKYDVFKVWQLAVDTQVDNTVVTIKTCAITCTSGIDKPKYFPGSDEDKKSCLKKRK